MKLQHLAASLALGVVVLAGCHADESLNPPPPPPVPSGGALFQRYVAMGNSITAGFQSAGINDSTQQQSYAVLFANAAGAEFTYPSLQGRGCPPPFTNNVTQARVGGGTAGTCDLRADNTLPNNLAVPGARALELLDNLGVPVSSSNALTLLFLGGRTQLEAMMVQKPTFVSLWIGNNDVLGALTSSSNPGFPLAVTDSTTFANEYREILDSIEGVGAKAVLVSVADVSVIPYASKGTVYWCLKNAPACGPPFPATSPFPATFTVDNNCSPAGVGLGGNGDSILVPWPKGVPRIAAAAQGASTNLDCSQDTVVVNPTEYAGLRNAVQAYNSFIQSEATARGWAYLNVNAPLLALAATGAIPAFPDLTAALSGGSVGFGPYFSLDGVHPDSLAHVLVADSLTSVINVKYGTLVPLP